jgi:hypothetical protein
MRNMNLWRYIGLDPAAPMFEQATEVERLDRTDADFVDVIHSSRLGLYDRIGHVDFYGKKKLFLRSGEDK